MPTPFDSVAAKLQLAISSGAFCFGSGGHRFALNPPLQPGFAQQTEQIHGFSLPADYRDFLEHAGDGGAGPYYGIAPFAQALGDIPERLKLPFPVAPPAEEQDTPQTEDTLDYEDLCNGSLLLGSQGCAYEMRLVVSGPAAGRVVYVDRENPEACYFPPDQSFAEWYLRWLDLALEGELDDWFGFDNPAYGGASPSAMAEAPAAPLEPPPVLEVPVDGEPYREQLLRIRQTLINRGQLNRHRLYRPPMSEEALQDLEKRHQIQLCPDLRAFLKYLYAGGPGPFDGLELFEFGGIDSPYCQALISRPFPHTRQQVLEPRFQGVTIVDDIRPEGTIHLAHLRICYHAFLVITGPERGRVFYLNCGIQKPRPYFLTDANFLDWFERWMTKGYGPWFGLDNPDYRLEKEPGEFDMPVWHPARQGRPGKR